MPDSICCHDIHTLYMVTNYVHPCSQAPHAHAVHSPSSMTPQTPLQPTMMPATTCDDICHATDAALCWPSPGATYRSPGPTPVDHHTCTCPNAPQLYPRHPDVHRLTTTRPVHQRPPVAHWSSPNGTTHGCTHASRAPRPMRRSQMHPVHPPQAMTLVHVRPGPHQ